MSTSVGATASERQGEEQAADRGICVSLQQARAPGLSRAVGRSVISSFCKGRQWVLSTGDGA